MLPGLSHVDAASSEEVAEAILKRLGVDDTCGGGGSSREPEDPPAMGAAQRKLMALTEDNGLIFEVCEFMKTNIDAALPVRFQPSFQALFTAVSAKVTALDPSVWSSVRTMLSQLTQEVLQIVPEYWLDFARLVPEVLLEGSSTSIEAASNGVFSSEDQMKRFFNTRALYLLELVSSLATGPSRMTPSFDLALPVSGLFTNVDLVTQVLNTAHIPHIVDINAQSSDAWGDLCSEVFQIAIECAQDNQDPDGQRLASALKTKLGKSNASTESTVEAQDAEADAANFTSEGPANDSKNDENVQAAADKPADASRACGDDFMQTLAEIRSAWKEEVPPSVLRGFMWKVQFFLWEAAMMTAQRKLASGNLQPENGHARLKAFPDDISENPQIYAAEVTQTLNLNFVGRVTRVAAVGDLPLTKIGDCSFYLSGDGHNAFACDDFVPAWMIQEIADEEWALMDHTKNVRMHVSSITIPFTFKFPQGAKEQTITCDLVVRSLSPGHRDIGKKCVRLWRTPIASECKHNPPQPAAKSRAKSKAKSSARGSAKPANEWAHAKHLFR